MSKPDIIVLHGVPFAVAVPCRRDACSKCMFGTPGKHECKASDLMDMNVVPVCDIGGIGYDCYYRKPTEQEVAEYMKGDSDE